MAGKYKQHHIDLSDFESDEWCTPPATPPPSRMSMWEADTMSQPVTNADVQRYIISQFRAHAAWPEPQTRSAKRRRVSPKPAQRRISDASSKAGPPESSAVTVHSEDIQPRRCISARVVKPAQSPVCTKRSCHSMPERQPGTGNYMSVLLTDEESGKSDDEDVGWLVRLRRLRREKDKERIATYQAWWSTVRDLRRKARNRRVAPDDGLTLAERIRRNRQGKVSGESQGEDSPCLQRAPSKLSVHTSSRRSYRDDDISSGSESMEPELVRLQSPETSRQRTPLSSRGASPCQPNRLSPCPTLPAIVNVSEDRSQTFHGTSSQRQRSVNEKRSKTSSPSLPQVSPRPVVHVKENAYVRSPSRKSSGHSRKLSATIVVKHEQQEKVVEQEVSKAEVTEKWAKARTPRSSAVKKKRVQSRGPEQDTPRPVSLSSEKSNISISSQKQDVIVAKKERSTNKQRKAVQSRASTRNSVPSRASSVAESDSDNEMKIALTRAAVATVVSSERRQSANRKLSAQSRVSVSASSSTNEAATRTGTPENQSKELSITKEKTSECKSSMNADLNTRKQESNPEPQPNDNNRVDTPNEEEENVSVELGFSAEKEEPIQAKQETTVKSERPGETDTDFSLNAGTEKDDLHSEEDKDNTNLDISAQVSSDASAKTESRDEQSDENSDEDNNLDLSVNLNADVSGKSENYSNKRVDKESESVNDEEKDVSADVNINNSENESESDDKEMSVKAELDVSVKNSDNEDNVDDAPEATDSCDEKAEDKIDPSLDINIANESNNEENETIKPSVDVSVNAALPTTEKDKPDKPEDDIPKENPPSPDDKPEEPKEDDLIKPTVDAPTESKTEQEPEKQAPAKKPKEKKKKKSKKDKKEKKKNEASQSKKKVKPGDDMEELIKALEKRADNNLASLINPSVETEDGSENELDEDVVQDLLYGDYSKQLDDFIHAA